MNRFILKIFYFIVLYKTSIIYLKKSLLREKITVTEIGLIINNLQKTIENIYFSLL